jgi:TRAP-type mannitol/chloroaromatic compound transport system permease small subunit
LLILVGVYNVVTRYVGFFLRRPLASNSLLDLQWQLFSLLFFLGFSYILKRNENVRVDFLYSKWSPKRQALVNLLGHIFFLIPFCIIGLAVAVQPVRFAWMIRETSPDFGGLPRYPIKTMMLIGFSWLLIQAVSECIKHAAVLLDAIPKTAEQAIEAYSPEPVE